MEVVKNIVIKKGGIKPILVDFFYNKISKNMPIVIFCHGYKGFKDWGAWDIVGKEFANKNFFFIKFNFSHNGGTVEDPIDFPDLEAFGNNTFSHELNDLERVLNFISCEKSVFKNIDLNNIFLIGHSRGGGTTPDNVIPVHKMCNQAKSSMTMEELVGLADKIRNHHG